jgi:hypothetical protein
MPRVGPEGVAGVVLFVALPFVNGIEKNAADNSNWGVNQILFTRTGGHSSEFGENQADDTRILWRLDQL